METQYVPKMFTNVIVFDTFYSNIWTMNIIKISILSKRHKSLSSGDNCLDLYF